MKPRNRILHTRRRWFRREAALLARLREIASSDERASLDLIKRRIVLGDWTAYEHCTLKMRRLTYTEILQPASTITMETVVGEC